MGTPPDFGTAMREWKRAQAINRLPIECPKCGLKHETPRDIDDPEDAVRALILCPECCGGDFGTTTYFDVNGHELIFGPDGYRAIAKDQTQ